MAFPSDCLVRSGQSISAVMSCVPQALQAVVQLCKSQFSISKMIKKEGNNGCCSKFTLFRQDKTASRFISGCLPVFRMAHGGGGKGS